VAGLKQAFRKGDLCLPAALQPLTQDKVFRSFLRTLFRQDRVVYAKKILWGPTYETANY
jgi:hypothetical protein